jgi:hypothetical protein
MTVELVAALIIAVPIALAVTGVAMRIAARHNYAVERWEYFCQGKE